MHGKAWPSIAFERSLGLFKVSKKHQFSKFWHTNDTCAFHRLSPASASSDCVARCNFQSPIDGESDNLTQIWQNDCDFCPGNCWPAVLPGLGFECFVKHCHEVLFWTIIKFRKITKIRQYDSFGFSIFGFDSESNSWTFLGFIHNLFFFNFKMMNEFHLI